MILSHRVLPSGAKTNHGEAKRAPVFARTPVGEPAQNQDQNAARGYHRRRYRDQAAPVRIFLSAACSFCRGGLRIVMVLAQLVLRLTSINLVLRRSIKLFPKVDICLAQTLWTQTPHGRCSTVGWTVLHDRIGIQGQCKRGIFICFGFGFWVKALPLCRTVSEVHPLTCQMQDRVRPFRVLLQGLDSFGRRQYLELDFAAMSLAVHLFHHRQRSGSGADHKPLTLPGYLLFYRERCMPKPVMEPFGRFFLALTDVPRSST